MFLNASFLYARYSFEHFALEKLRNLSKDFQIVGSRARRQTQVFMVPQHAMSALR